MKPGSPHLIRQKTAEDQLLAVVRASADPANFGAALATALEAVWAYLNSLPDVTAGPAIARYLEAERPAGQDEVVFEAGFAVASAVPETDVVRVVRLPAGRVVTIVQEGGYEYLPAAHDALRAWLAERGLRSAQAPYEIYWVDQTHTDQPSELRTEVVYPLDG
jgi:effector-binding domain-containing protein